jgi:short-subunit dehydrogenase
VYEGGGGYTAAKHAQTAVAETLRLELCGRPIRVVEIDPGMVRTEGFALNRFGGDAEQAEAVYQGVPNPLTAEDVADCVAWCVTRPHHVNIDRLVVRPLAQAAQHKVHREARGASEASPAVASRDQDREARGASEASPAVASRDQDRV